MKWAWLETDETIRKSFVTFCLFALSDMNGNNRRIPIVSDPILTSPLSSQLKAHTHAIHEQLDHAIMTAGMFSDRPGYQNFVLVQYRFHRDLNVLYGDPALARIVPDLPARNRFAQLVEDMADLDIPTPEATERPVAHDPSEAMGWLYVAEGSKLGAGILTRLAEKLGFGASFGARHLQPDPAGRGRSWSAFQEAIDRAGLDPDRCVIGAESGFTRVIDYLGSVTSARA